MAAPLLDTPIQYTCNNCQHEGSTRVKNWRCSACGAYKGKAGPTPPQGQGIEGAIAPPPKAAPPPAAKAAPAKPPKPVVSPPTGGSSKSGNTKQNQKTETHPLVIALATVAVLGMAAGVYHLAVAPYLSRQSAGGGLPSRVAGRGRSALLPPIP